jgi:hypothetical protein
MLLRFSPFKNPLSALMHNDEATTTRIGNEEVKEQNKWATLLLAKSIYRGLVGLVGLVGLSTLKK